MKTKVKILLILFVFTIGCTTVSVVTRDGEIGEDVKPLMERTADEDKITIGVPIYKF